jgi:hypothetical protein
MSGKAAKILLGVIFLAGAALIAARSIDTSKNDIAKQSQFVCVATGEIFNLDLDKVAIIPAPNPNTGERTLLPCSKGDDGVMRVSERYRQALSGELKDKDKYVDPYNLEVLSSPRQ